MKMRPLYVIDSLYNFDDAADKFDPAIVAHDAPWATVAQ
jgi:hypothetical protein